MCPSLLSLQATGIGTSCDSSVLAEHNPKHFEVFAAGPRISRWHARATSVAVHTRSIKIRVFLLGLDGSGKRHSHFRAEDHEDFDLFFSFWFRAFAERCLAPAATAISAGASSASATAAAGWPPPAGFYLFFWFWFKACGNRRLAPASSATAALATGASSASAAALSTEVSTARCASTTGGLDEHGAPARAALKRSFHCLNLHALCLQKGAVTDG